jgi:hypothetical protein
MNWIHFLDNLLHYSKVQVYSTSKQLNKIRIEGVSKVKYDLFLFKQILHSHNIHHNNVTILEWLQMGFGLVIGFTEHLWTITTSNYSTIANSHMHTQHVLSLLSLLCLHQSFGNSFQWRMFPFLWIPKLSECLSYQFLKASAHMD